MAGKRTKRPSKRAFRHYIRACRGDYAYIAQTIGCHRDTVRKWVDEYGLSDFVLRVRLPASVVAESVWLKEIEEHENPLYAKAWLERDDRLREQQAAEWDQQETERRIADILGGLQNGKVGEGKDR